MNPRDKQVVIVGAGVAGLAAADEAARWGAGVTLLEQATQIGGHAARFNCKALDQCVACGACLVNERRQRVMNQGNVSILTGVRITGIERTNRFVLGYMRLENTGTEVLKADALLLTSGFQPYDPSEKPYGYGLFPNVLTLLEAEDRMRRHAGLTCSDGKPPDRIAFIQCVGSRDSRIGHPWCSKICCGAALRMARLIQQRRPETTVTFFYIDVQTFGKNFQKYYDQTRRQVRMVRAIPGDIVQIEGQRLQAAYFDPDTSRSLEEPFDMVVLSAGITPNPDNARFADMLGVSLTETGFFPSHGGSEALQTPGIFTAGAANGPMGIAESIDSAGKAVWDLINYLKMNDRPKS